MKPIRRLLAFVCLAGAVSGCTPLAQGSFDTLRSTFVRTSSLPDESGLDPTAAYMLARSGKQQIVLGRGRTQDQGSDTWYTGSRQVFVMRQGLLVSTTGLPEDLLDVRYEAPHPLLAKGGLVSLPSRFVRYIQRPGQRLETTHYEIATCGERQISSWGHKINARCFRERIIDSNVASPLPGNTYWLSTESGEWVQTTQWLSPDWPILLQPRPGNPEPVIRLAQPVTINPDQSAHILVAVAPTRLSELLLSYPLPASRLSPSYWLTHEEVPVQRKLKLGVLFDLNQALIEGRFVNDEARQRLKRFRDRLAVMPITGRRSLPVLQPRWLQANPTQDPVFNGGDRLMRRYLPATTVRVIGDVVQDCPASEGGGSVLELLRRCLGGRALPDTVYVIDASGQVSAADVALWNRAEIEASPGSLIFVPFPQLAGVDEHETAGLDIARWLATQIDAALPETDAP